MSKELEKFYDLLDNIYTKNKKQFIAEQGLQKLESMDNENSSEVLESLKELEERCKNDYDQCIVGYDYKKELDIIKQALLTKSKKEQAFDIVIKLITFDDEDPELSTDLVLAVACLQTFGEKSEEFKIIREVLNISEEECTDYVTKYCNKKNENESK